MKTKLTGLLALLTASLLAGSGCGSNDDSDANLEIASDEDRGITNANNDVDPSEEDPPLTPEEEEAPPPKKAVVQVASNTPHDAEDIDADLGDLNSALEAFMDDSGGRLPTIKQLMGSGYLNRFPSYPAGKAYVLDKQRKQFVVKNL